MFELGNIGSYMKSGYNAMEQGALSMAPVCLLSCRFYRC